MVIGHWEGWPLDYSPLGKKIHPHLSTPLNLKEAGFIRVSPTPTHFLGEWGQVGELGEGGRRGKLAALSFSVQPSGPGAWAGGGGRAAAGDLLSSHGKIGL